jgi:hypothetical protein
MRLSSPVFAGDRGHDRCDEPISCRLGSLRQNRQGRTQVHQPISRRGRHKHRVERQQKDHPARFGSRRLAPQMLGPIKRNAPSGVTLCLEDGDVRIEELCFGDNVLLVLGVHREAEVKPR